MKTIEINGETFELCTANPEKFKACISAAKRYEYYDLENWYNNPSRAKRGIYNEWSEWSTDYRVYRFGVSGGTCHFFSISGTIKDVYGFELPYTITAYHNRLFIPKGYNIENIEW